MNLSSLTSNTSGYGSNGFSGLASGIDTESMVEAMLSGTQNKIDKQYGLKQQTLWKQEMYRSIIKTINTFQSKYFSSTSSTNFLSNNFFNLMNAVSNSSKFKVNATSSATTGKYELRVDQLATNAKITTGAGVSGKLEGMLDVAKLDELVQQNIDADRTVTFRYDGQDVVVDLTDCFIDSGATPPTYNSLNADDRADAIADAITQAFLGAGYGEVTAEAKNGTLTITGTDKTKAVGVSSASNSEGLKAIGLSSGRTSSTSGDNTVLSGTMNTNAEITFNVTLDDNVKEIGLNIEEFIDNSNVIDMGKLETELRTQLNKAHGNGQITVVRSGNDIEFKVTEGRKVMVSGKTATLDAFGFLNGQSNRIALGGTLTQNHFSTPLQGTNYKFSINGVRFEFDQNSTITEVMNTINSSGAGVRVTYKSLDDTFSIESTNSGAGHAIDFNQTEGNLLNAMFGNVTATGNTATTKYLVGNTIEHDPSYVMPTGNVAKGGTFTMKVNGTTYKFEVPEKSDSSDYDIQEIVDSLNDQFDEKFGDGSIVIGTDGKLTINNGANVEIPASGLSGASDPGLQAAIDGGDLNVLFGLGLSGSQNNLLTDNTTLAELGFGSGDTITIGGTTLGAGHTINNLLQNGFSWTNDGRLVYDGATGAVFNGDTAKILFGVDSLALGVSNGAAYSEITGKNAKIWIDGVETERSSNSFSINGINIELTAVHENGETDIIEVSRGVDTIVDAIKSFMTDYNAMIDEINTLIRQETNYKSYAPLTEAQKKEMTEREIDLWEEKAKEGLLRNDSTLSAFLSSMRTAIYEKPAGSLFAIYDLGIETSSEWKDYGKLVFTTDGEAKLRQALESNPDDVIKLFTDSEEGLAVKLNDICKKAANETSGSPGTLVQIAGVKTRATEYNNELYNRIKAIDEKIAQLQRTYEKEKSRYWRQFNSMESYINTMNSQSSWLYYQLGQ